MLANIFKFFICVSLSVGLSFTTILAGDTLAGDKEFLYLIEFGSKSRLLIDLVESGVYLSLIVSIYTLICLFLMVRIRKNYLLALALMTTSIALLLVGVLAPLLSFALGVVPITCLLVEKLWSKKAPSLI